MTRQTFILAVSGGVDSVVLLHRLMANKPLKIQYIVAHFDHGIRKDSAADAKFVQSLADRYDLPCVIGQGKLGAKASEADARSARYAFLRELMRKHKAEKIVTAHHQDDLLESMVLGMMRSSGYRSLVPMSATDVLRPLIHKRKPELVEYAKQHKLSWRDDPSNTDETYLRNYVRKHVMPKLEPARQKLLQINVELKDKLVDIDMRTASLVPTNNTLSRPRYVIMPYRVLCEVSRAWLQRSGVQEVDRSMINRMAIAIKTLPVGKKVDIAKGLWLESQPQVLLLTKKKPKSQKD